MKIPTDLEILSDIYEQNYNTFCNFQKSDKNRANKLYVPIDIQSVAYRLNVDPDIVFGRLYYHLEEKYSYQKKDGSWVHFFSLNIGGDRHVVNFPLLASVLAGLKEERDKNNRSMFFSLFAIVISLSTLIAKVLGG